MSIIKLDIKKIADNTVDLDDQQNLTKLKQYVFPVITNNQGWGTAGISFKDFCENPKKFQTVIDAYDNPHVYIKENEPIAIFEYEKGTIADNSESSLNVKNILNGENKDILKSLGVVETYREEIETNSKEIGNYLLNIPIYKSIGIVIKPVFQNKKEGIAQELYKLVSDGVVFGSTSNPIVVRKRRQIFPNTYYFPMMNENFHSFLGLTSIVLTASDLLTASKEQLVGLEFGAQYSDYYIEDRGEQYLELASDMMIKNKISKYDFDRIKYVLSRKKCASVIISFPS